MGTQTQPINEQATQAAPPPAAEQQPPQQQTARVDLGQIIGETERQMERLHVDEARFGFQQRRAKLFAASGLFGVKDATPEQALAQAMVKIELGEAMGFTPAESLQGVHVINGATAIAAAIRAARMQAAGYSWDLEWLGTAQECAGCRLWLYFRGKPLMQPRRDADGNVLRDEKGDAIMDWVSVAYTKTDAQKMLTTIWEGNSKKRVSILEKDNWKMSPKNMYFARAITNAQRWHAPAVLSVNLPSVEEAMDFDAEARTAGPMRASVPLDNFKPSADANRGHDAASAPATESPKRGRGRATEEAAAPDPYAKLINLDTFPALAAVDDKEVVKVKGKLYRFDVETGNYTELQ